jgi:hypothetical protein
MNRELPQPSTNDTQLIRASPQMDPETTQINRDRPQTLPDGSETILNRLHMMREIAQTNREGVKMNRAGLQTIRDPPQTNRVTFQMMREGSQTMWEGLQTIRECPQTMWESLQTDRAVSKPQFSTLSLLKRVLKSYQRVSKRDGLPMEQPPGPTPPNGKALLPPVDHSLVAVEVARLKPTVHQRRSIRSESRHLDCYRNAGARNWPTNEPGTAGVIFWSRPRGTGPVREKKVARLSERPGTRWMTGQSGSCQFHCGAGRGALKPEQRRTRRKHGGLRRRGRAIAVSNNELFDGSRILSVDTSL